MSQAPKEKAHALFSPSAIDRAEACPGSVLFTCNMWRKSSAAAEEGTRAHECLEMFLKNGSHQVPATKRFLLNAYPVPMIDYALEAAKTLWKKARGRKVHSERRCDLSHVDKDLWGTLDASIPEDFGTLEIADFKFGKFIAVSAVKNTQLLTYAVGEARRLHYNFDQVKLTILQPRAAHPEGPVRSWSAPMQALFDWEKHLREIVKRARAKNAPFVAGEHCFFCPAKTECATYTPDATASLRASFVSNAIANESPEAAKRRMAKLFGDPKDADQDEEW